MVNSISPAQLKGNSTKASKYLKYDSAQLVANLNRKKLREQQLVEQLTALREKIKLYESRLSDIAILPSEVTQ